MHEAHIIGKSNCSVAIHDLCEHACAFILASVFCSHASLPPSSSGVLSVTHGTRDFIVFTITCKFSKGGM